MLTVIEFDNKGRPLVRNVDTGQFIHDLKDYHRLMEFTEFEKAWFRKPLGK